MILTLGLSQAQAKDTSEIIDVPDGKVQLVDWSRLSGESRLDTMSAISNAGFDSADTVIIANAYNFPDALSATALAGYYDAPILLSGANSLDAQTKAEIERLGATKAIIVGGNSVISENTKSEIEALDKITSVTRISGEDRYATSLAIYNAGNKAGAWDTQDTKTAIIASGESFADALSVSPYAYAKGAPIFLTSKDSLTQDIADALKAGDFDKVVIVGGEGVVSNNIDNALSAVLKDTTIERVSGLNRYETSIKIADWATYNGMSYEGIAIATGENFPDALSGGALCGKRESLILLASEYENTKVIQKLSDNKAAIKQANIFGGDAVISTNLYQKMQEATLGDSEPIDFSKVELDTEDKVYNGSAFKPEVSIEGLVEDNDFVVTYGENTDAGKGTITVTGIGSYTGENTWTFKILRADISVADVELTTPELVYTGDEQTQDIESVEVNNRTLVEDTDYQVVKNTGKEAADYELIITGLGNYEGAKLVAWKISTATLSQDQKNSIALNDADNIIYDGKEKKPSVTMPEGMKQGVDYDVAYEDNIEAGTAKATITFKGNYDGNNPVELPFSIKPVTLTDEQLKNLDVDDEVYDGAAKTPELKGMPDGLVEGTDYEVTYANNTNAGIDTATVTITFKGNYASTPKKELTFTIEQADISSAKITLKSDSFDYDGSTHKPVVSKVVLGEKTLTATTDYTDVVSEQTIPGDYILSVEGTGNYKGSASVDWKIVSNDAVFDGVTLDDKGYTYDGNAKNPTVIGMPKGIDYTIEYLHNTDAGTATAIVKTSDGQTKAFDFVIAPKDLTGAKVTVDPTEYIYDSTLKTVSVSVTKDGNTISADSYTTFGTSATNVGDYTATVNFKGNYTGTSSADWKIKPASLSAEELDAIVLGGADSYIYDSTAKTPEVKGIPEKLIKGTDYDIAYSNNINATTDTSKAAVAITFKGNWAATSTKTLNFEIAPYNITGATVTVTPAEYTYDGKPKTVSVSSVVKDGTTIPTTGYTTSGLTGTEADTYTATVTASGGNYTGSATAGWEIKSATLTNEQLKNLDVDDAVYDGTPKTPSVTGMPDGLVEGTDYEVEYTNNTDAGVDTATAAVSFKGNYASTPKQELTFTIEQADISSAKITLVQDSYDYDSSAHTPEVSTVVLGEKTLTANTDYTVVVSAQTIPGDYILSVEGIGNYKGSASVDWKIVSNDAVFDGVTLDDKGYTYDGNAKNPTVIGMPKGIDYTIEYLHNTDAGTATAIVKTSDGQTKAFDFVIAPKDLTGAKVTVDPTEYTYDNTSKTVSVSVTLEDGTTVVSADNYTTIGTSATNIGNYTATVNFKGNYTGTASADWKIKPITLSTEERAAIALDTQDQIYDGTQKKPSVTGLPKDMATTDYEVIYANNINATTQASLAKALVIFKGNYVGNDPIDLTFQIAPYDITGAIVTLTSDEFDYDNTLKTVSVISVVKDGTTIPTTGYTTSGLSATDADEYTATVTGTGNYTGSATAGWEIKPATLSTTERAAIALDAQDQIYDGTQKKPSVTGLPANMTATDYEVAYANNIDAGTAKATVSFKGNYEGNDPIELTFEIAPYDITGAIVTLDFDEFDYDNAEKTVSVTSVVKDGKTIPSTGYTTSGLTGTNAGTYTATVTATGGNYTGSASTDWTINSISLSEEQIEEIVLNPDDLTGLVYSGIEKTPSVTGLPNGFVKGTDYEVTYANNVNAGTNTATAIVSFKGNYANTEAIALPFSINPYDISNSSIAFANDGATYTGNEISTGAATVTLDTKLADGTETITQGKDLAFSGGTMSAKNAGTYSVTVAGAGNFTGTLTSTWTIKQADLPEGKIPTVDTLEAGAGAKLSSVTLPTLDDGTLAWSSEYEADATVGDEITTIERNATYTPTDTNYKPVTIVVEIDVKESYTVTFNANGGKFSDSATTLTQSVVKDGYATAPTAPTYDDHTFDGWYTSEDEGTTLSDDAYDFENTAVTDNITLYAKWTASASAPSAYFLAASATDAGFLGELADGTATDEMRETLKFVSQAQIDADIAVLSGSDSTEKTAVEEKWKGYMASDTAGLSYEGIHLYTRWKGSDVRDDTLTYESWLECRIVQVGEHDGDGSAVTFMATHSLPTAQQMYTDSTDGGWAGSTLYTSTMSSYVKSSLDSDFLDALTPVTKKAYSGSNAAGWDETGTVTDSIWLMSYSELTGKYTDGTDYLFAGNEGSQYEWFKTYVTNPTGTNDAIRSINNTRSGATTCQNAWLRSPALDYSCHFLSVDSTYGKPSNYVPDSIAANIVPAFAMGVTKQTQAHAVTFNANGGTFADGSTTTTSTVTDGGYATAPTTDPVYSGTGMVLGGWYTSTDGGTTLSDNAYDFDSTTVTDDITLYAKWTEAGTNDYFLAKGGLDTDTLTALAAGTASGEIMSNNYFVPQAKIASDMSVLHGSDSATKTAVETKWTGYMDSDTGTGDDDTVHLYTTWSGKDATTDADKWVEFRIIEVGEHDSDGSAVTFMATHALPTGMQMYGMSSTGYLGYGKSQMYQFCFNSGTTETTDRCLYIYSLLPDSFMSAIQTVSKKYMYGVDYSYVYSGSADCKMWPVSYSEITGTTYTNYMGRAIFGDDGSQYSWFNGKVPNTADLVANPLVSGLGKTRGNAYMNGTYYGSSAEESSLWLRTQSLPTKDPGPETFNYAIMYNNGALGTSADSAAGLAVCPAFAM